MISGKLKKIKIIYTSSVAVYPENIGVVDENSELLSNSEYRKSKIYRELVIGCHFQFSIIRILHIYGIDTNDTTFIPRIIVSALKNVTIKIYGDSCRFQNYIHVSDVAEFFIRAARIHLNNIYLAVGNR